ncbi:NAD-dependent malic enzyme, mitochondrial [Hypoxylon texense]
MSATLRGPAAIPLTFFCGLHKAGGGMLDGPKGMIRSLILQLLNAIGGNKVTMAPPNMNAIVEGVMADEFEDLLSVLRAAFEFVRSGMVLCFIDGASWYAGGTDGMAGDMARAMAHLQGLAGRANADNRGLVLKVLVTNPTPRQRYGWPVESMGLDLKRNSDGWPDPPSGLSPPEALFGSSIPSSLDHIPSQDMGEYVEGNCSTKRPCYAIEPFSSQPEFVGRDDVFHAIDACFLLNSEPGRVHSREISCCTISGLGGMGKTQTAIEYALARRDRFDAIFVVQADGGAKLSESFARIAAALGLMQPTDKTGQAVDDANLTVSRSKAMEWLSAPKFARTTLDHKAGSPRNTNSNNSGYADEDIKWLLIFDNVEDASVRPWVLLCKPSLYHPESIVASMGAS